MKAALFDSGVGGLTVAKSLIEHRLFEEIIYFGDTARVPYGTKDKNTIIRYSLEALEFFKNFDVDMLITACNSVSAHALAELKKNAPFPVIGVIEPGVLALRQKRISKTADILIIGTQATISSQKYQFLLTNLGYENITAKATPLFVPLVEEGIVMGEIVEATMRHYFQDMRPDAVILGCTHFPLLSQALQNYFGKNCLLIHSGDAIVEYLEVYYGLKRGEEPTSVKLFASENPEKLRSIAQQWRIPTTIIPSS